MTVITCPHLDVQDPSFHILEVPPFSHILPHQCELGSATQDKEQGLLVALEGPIGGSLVFILFPALGQDPVEQAWGSVRLKLGGHGLRRRVLGPPHREGALVLALAPIQPHSSSSSSCPASSAPPPERL